MLPNNESVNKVSRETILRALQDESIANSLSDDVLVSIIRNEMDQGEFGMDTQLFDACTQLLWNRHASITTKQLEKSERRSLKRLRRYMKRSAAESQSKRFLLRPIMASVIILLLLALPMLIENRPFKVSTTRNGEQYFVVGIQRNETGIARASMNRDTIGSTYELEGLEAIAPVLGYAIELPSWIPKECSLESIMVARNVTYDELLVTYIGDKEQRITILVTLYDSRDGQSSGYEQSYNGHLLKLENGASVYVTNNINSSWGLYHSSNMDYFIDMAGFDETTLMKVFNSTRR